MNVKITNSKRHYSQNTIRKLGVLLLTVYLLSPFLIHAQTKELSRHYVDSDISLRSDDNVSKRSTQMITYKISQKGATWLRLFFKDVNLGKESTLTITSDLDGSSQILDGASIKQWKNTSAYFNGNRITLTLNVARNERSVGFSIKEIGIGDLDSGSETKSQCGATDDRVDSTDDAIGRIVPIGCTGWIITNGRLVTAGHCVSARAEVIEFNVPKSNANGSIVHPGVQDQYPIGNFVSPYPNSPSQANDWAVFTASANSQTNLTPIQAQGKSFNVVRDNPGSNITITGFGVDTGNDNQTQQIHTGPTASFTNTFVRYVTDTEGGNSGSPIIDAATGNAIGVHAYGGCSSGSNSGERATIPAFWDAMGLGGTTPPPTEECSGDISSFPYSESFEGSIGSWSQSTADDINWTVNSGGTPSAGTGPGSAIDGSSYIYVEASGDGTGFPNKQAILNSPCLDFNGISAPSFSFQYHMIGNAVGSLDVEVRTNNTGNWVSVFNKSGAQGTDWNTAEIDLSSYAGDTSVQLRLNVVTGTSWEGDIAIDDLAIINGGGLPSPTCNSLDFNDFSLNSFSTQDIVGNASVGNGGSSLSLSDNTWKYIVLNYSVTASTVIEFDFSSDAEGEIHAVGFENDNDLTATQYFKVFGTQDYGVTNFDDYVNGTKKYVIPVGNFYTGSMDRLVFINDNDAGSGNTSTFSNVKIYEGSCGQSVSAEHAIASMELVTPIIGVENEKEAFSFTLTNNSQRNDFSIHLNSTAKKANAVIYSILGQVQSKMVLENGVNTFSKESLLLSQGIYLVKVDNAGGESMTKKLIIQ